MMMRRRRRKAAVVVAVAACRWSLFKLFKSYSCLFVLMQSYLMKVRSNEAQVDCTAWCKIRSATDEKDGQTECVGSTSLLSLAQSVVVEDDAVARACSFTHPHKWVLFAIFGHSKSPSMSMWLVHPVYFYLHLVISLTVNRTVTLNFMSFIQLSLFPRRPNALSLNHSILRECCLRESEIVTNQQEKQCEWKYRSSSSSSWLTFSSESTTADK